jgi:Rrf2 family protein
MAKIVGFSEATYIALHCMVLVAESSGRISIKNMAEKLGVSEAHLAKVVLRLSRSGLLDTTRGPNGGAVLAKSPKGITFFDIVESIDGPIERSGCVFGRKECVYGECIFGGFLAKMTDDAKGWLSSRDLAYFMNNKN